MKLATSYLGLALKHPFIAGASPLPGDLPRVRELEDAGIAAITMYSLFEEQITQNLVGRDAHIAAYEESFAEAVSYFPESGLLERGVESYLEQVRKVREAVDVPVIGSLNGTREGAWVDYASLIESAGADALELNLYFLPTDFEESAASIEDRCVRIVRAVKSQIRIPLAVKLSPFFTALPHFARRLGNAGADGLVCFNRFYQPDIDIESIELKPSLELSHSTELRLRLRWLAMLSERLPCDLAVSGGVHTGVDAAKAIMCGAHAVQLVSTLLINGAGQVEEILDELLAWAAEEEYESIDDLRGCMNHTRCPDPAALERANYMRVLNSWRV